jgi:endonuclease/exonuclease/phosphatase (EEP) superfamily protein YafD
MMRTSSERVIGAEPSLSWGSLPATDALRTVEAGTTPVALILLVLLFAGLFGEWVPLADSLGVFRPQIASLIGAFGVVFLVSRKYFCGALFLFCAVAAQTSVFTASAGYETASSHAMSLYQKNLLVTGSSPEAIAEDIRSTEPDFVTLQEVSNHNLSKIRSLISSYPDHFICHSNKKGAVALLSDHPLVPGSARCYADLNLALAQVDVGDDRIWVASLHLDWPFPYGQANQARRVANVLLALDGKVIVAGDFNMVPWGGSVARITRAIRGQMAGPSVNSFPAFQPLVPLSIDHVLLPSGARASVEARPLLGSDHYGVLTRFELSQ